MICNQKLNKNLDALGFRESYTGTDYIRAAVAMVEAQRDVMMSKDIYPALARAGGRTPASVERSIRTAISAAMESPTWDFSWREMGGWGRPTNSELIHRLARESADEN